MKDGSYHFRCYGASVRVDAPEGIPLSTLRSRVAREVVAERSAEGPSDLHLTRWSGEYRLVHGERRYGPYRSLETALRALANGIHFLIGKRSPMTFVHAGAVEMDGGAIVFPGRGRYRRSSLVATLVEEGCGYLSDIYAVVSSEGTVFPLSPSIALEGESGTDDIVADGVGRPGGYECRAIVFYRYEDGDGREPRPLTAGEAAMELIPLALKSEDDPEQVLRDVVGLLGDAICQQRDAGPGEPSMSVIRSLVGISDTAREARL